MTIIEPETMKEALVIQTEAKQTEDKQPEVATNNQMEWLMW
jgi:hypothetical protein